MKKQKGITLVALVITIILLLILSGITIQSITNKGIISNTKRAELENKRGQIAETLQVRLITEQSNKFRRNHISNKRKCYRKYR